MIPNLFIYTTFNFKCCILILLQYKYVKIYNFKCFWKKSLLDLAYLIKNTEKNNNIEILLQFKIRIFLFYFTLKYIYVMQKWFFMSHYSTCHVILH